MADPPPAESRAVRLRRVLREVASGTVTRLRRHDTMLAAAGLTFYSAIAIVPLLLIGWWLAALVLGEQVVHELTRRLARYTPGSLGLASAVESLGVLGPRLNAAAVVAALLAGTTYGEGLVRAFDRVAETDRRAKGLRGRALALLLVAALGVAVLAELAVIAYVPDAVPAERSPLLQFYIAFWAGWIGSGFLVAVLFRAFSPRPVGGWNLFWSAAGTGSFLAGMTLGWVVLLEFGVDVGLAFGGSTMLGTLVLCAVYLFLVQMVLLVGYAATLELAERADPRASPTTVSQSQAASR